MKSYIILFLLSAIFSVISGETVLPATKEGDAIGLVILQGASIGEDTYVPLAKAIQAASDKAVWVSLPHCSLNACEPLVVGGTVTAGIKALTDKGFPSGAPIVVGGHSLGGAFVQDWASKNADKVVGQVLMGSFIKRSNRGSYPVPTLTIGGDLDGLARVSRLAEAYYHSVLHSADNGAKFPVVIVPGMSHMQFASGAPPLLVKHSDLKPDLSEDEAHQLSGQIIGAFLNNIGSSVMSETFSSTILQMALDKTGDYVKPLITGLEMEGFNQFKPACNSDYNMPAECPIYPRYPGKQQGDKVEKDCTCGTPWSVEAQRIMAGLPDTVEIDAVDAIHSVSDINPVHLPFIWSDVCKDENNCKINVTTVTQAVYSTLDKLDTGYSYTSADELRVKLKSRQTLWNAAGRADADFHQTDEVPNTCADINKAAWKWALDNAHPTALARFQKYGQPYGFGKDSGPYNAGPLWIYNAMSYKESDDGSEVVITSPMMHTDKSYFIKQAAGFHYCKLLSPARAMEWIYVDSLRKHGSINSSTSLFEENSSDEVYSVIV